MGKPEPILSIAQPAPALPPSKPAVGETLAPDAALRNAITVAGILAHSHKVGLLHGRLCPAAVVLNERGATVLEAAKIQAADFDAYRSPEQVRGKPADERSDVFCFGAVLFHMLSGIAPFSGEGDALNRAILENEPAWDAAGDRIPGVLRRVLEGCLEKSPLRRRQRIQNIAVELRLIQNQLRRAAFRPPPPSPPAVVRLPRLGMHLLIIAILVLALAVVAAGAVFWLFLR